MTLIVKPTGWTEDRYDFDTPLSLAWVERSGSYLRCLNYKVLGFVWCVKLWDECPYVSEKSGVSFEKLENVGFWTHSPRKSNV